MAALASREDRIFSPLKSAGRSWNARCRKVMLLLEKQTIKLMAQTRKKKGMRTFQRYGHHERHA